MSTRRCRPASLSRGVVLFLVAVVCRQRLGIDQQVAALKRALQGLHGCDAAMIGNVVSEIEHHLAQPTVDKDRLGRAVERALDYAKDADDFAEKLGTLAPIVRNVSGW